MKTIRIISAFALLSSLLFLTACEKDSEGVSKVTSYPIFTMNGDAFTKLIVADESAPFNDPGVTAALNGKSYPVTVTGDDIDVSVTGYYERFYTAYSDENYSTTTMRQVLITAVPLTHDLSGKYKWSRGKPTIKLAGKELGLYTIDDANWQDSPIPVQFVDLGDGTLKVLPTDSGYGVTTQNGPCTVDYATGAMTLNLIIERQSFPWTMSLTKL